MADTPHTPPLLALARRLLPESARRGIVAFQRRHRLQWPRTGSVDFAALRRLTPISPIFGMERGKPVDRHYIESFLATHASDVRGRALELGDPTYIRRFGGDRVTKTDVLNVVPAEGATIIADLTDCPHVASESFDCIIFTQAIQMIWDLKAAMRELYRITAPGGVILLTTHGTSKIARRLGRDAWGEYWRLTGQGLERLIDETMPGADAAVSTYGNVLSAASFLYGLAAEDLQPHELDVADPDFEVIVAARICKPAAQA